MGWYRCFCGHDLEDHASDTGTGIVGDGPCRVTGGCGSNCERYEPNSEDKA